MSLAAVRQQMIDHQVRAWDVFDPAVLAALGSIPREAFAPPAYAAVAYADTDIPLPHGEVMLAAKWVGRALQALEVRSGETALVVGAGTGYVPACLARLGAQVRALEIHPELAETARTTLAAVGIGGVEVETADGTQFAEQSSHDVVFVGGSLPTEDTRFRNALKVGGRLFEIVGEAPAMSARLVRRTTATQWTVEELFETNVPPLANARRPSAFQF
ncbi:MAG: protein-L-isoaspartate O-methyltransferase family protein [Gammaproteobacteria bacterium]